VSLLTLMSLVFQYHDHCINVYAAIVPNLLDEMILTVDAVDMLFMMPECDGSYINS